MTKIELTNGGFCLVDDEDVALVSGYNWGGYAHAQNRIRYAKSNKLRMHRLITGCPDHLEVDHINGDGLDNRRSNLRICSRWQNNANTKRNKPRSGYRGVYVTPGGRYRAMIARDNKLRNLGTVDNAEDAAKLYDTAAKELFGEFAVLNFVREVLPDDKS